MRVRTILKSLLFAYALTGVALLLLAFLLFTFDLGETAVDISLSMCLPASWEALWPVKLHIEINICGEL